MPLEIKPELEIIGNYDLVEKIAEGGMGSVYKGRHRQTRQCVAVKVLPPHLAGNPVFLKRFEQEYNATKALDHPNVVKAIEFGHEGATPFLVMEFVEGQSLGQRLDRVQRLGETEAIMIIGQVAQGLHKAHKLRLIHRDVKPDNILLGQDGQVKLVDLGLVKEVDGDLNLTRTNRGLGTPHFMAPEQFRNAKNADARCDIYSMAATLYMMVTGELPFKSSGLVDAWMKKINNEITAPRQVVPNLSERVDWAIRRSMSADPTLRAASCREFVEDLTGHSTRKMTMASPGVEGIAVLWYLYYEDEDGVVHTVKGSIDGIRRSLKEGLLGDAGTVRVARSKAGPFEKLRHHPEFRDLVVEPAPLPVKTAPRTPVPTPTHSNPHQETMATLPNLLEPAAPASSVTFSVPPAINLGGRSNSSEWIKVIVLVILALATGIAGYYLIPSLSYLRLW